MFSSVQYLIDASLLWGDTRMFLQQMQMLFNELRQFSLRLTEFSSKLPKNLKELFQWIELWHGKILCLKQAKRMFAKNSALTENGKVKASIRENGIVSFLCCQIGSHMCVAKIDRYNIKKTFEIAFCMFFRTFFLKNYVHVTKCKNNSYGEPNLRSAIKDQVPIETNEVMQLLKDFIISIDPGTEPNESSVKTMSVLLARIYLTSIEDNNPTTDDNCMSCDCPEPKY